MKLIPLTKGYSAMVDDSDFEWLNQWKWCALVGKNTIYATRSVKGGSGDGKAIKMHRFIMGVTDPKIEVDHEKGNGLDNTRNNLRVCTKSQNQMNKGSKPNSTSIYKGVSWSTRDRSWIVNAKSNGKSTHLGRFKNEEDAARAYNKHIKESHGDFAKYNQVKPMFPDPNFKQPRLASNNGSGFRGVCLNKKAGKWVSAVRYNGRQKYLGLFCDPIEAAKAYDQAALEIHGDNARLNFPNQ